MIDFIRLKFNEKHIIENHIKTHSERFFPEGRFNYNDAEIIYPLRGSIRNLNIKVSEKFGFLENSIHKYWNNINGLGIQNYNDFNFSDICNCLDNLEQGLEYDLKDTTLTNLEFGFNIDMGIISPSQFIDNNVIFHKLKTACYDPKNKPNMKIKTFSYTNFAIKIYDKSLQYGLPKQNTLRIEIKYTSKQEFNKFGIYSLADLRNPNVYIELLNDLLKRYDELTIIDSYDGNSSMKKKDRELLTRFTHQNYWKEVDEKYHPNTKTKRKKLFTKLIQDNNLDCWKQEIRNVLIEQYNSLTINSYNVNDSANILGESSHIIQSTGEVIKSASL